MDYYLLRKKFCEMSGRYDLINSDYTDNGADFYINAGQARLDRMQNTGQMKAKYVKQVAAGTIKVYVAGLRSVHKVWAGNSTEELIELSNAGTVEYLRSLYEKQLGDIDQGTPAWFAPAILRPFPDSSTSTSLSGYYDIDDLQLHATVPDHFTYSGIVIAPPPDSTYYISVYGTFYSPTLSATLLAGTWTQTKSMWTEVHPSILLKAALYELESFYRNTEGAKDWNNALMVDVTGIDHDFADQESYDINQMGG